MKDQAHEPYSFVPWDENIQCAAAVWALFAGLCREQTATPDSFHLSAFKLLNSKEQQVSVAKGSRERVCQVFEF